MIFYTSKINSIPFVDRATTGYKTDENSLSFEGKQFLSQRDIWYFQPNDTPVVQIKSDLSNIKAKIYKDSVFQEEIEAILKVENLNQNITLDCIVVDLVDSSNKGIKFTSGNTYNNPTDLTVLKAYNDITGSLPDFAFTDKNIIGKSITIDELDYKVLSFIYDETQNSWCLEIDTTILVSGDKIMSLIYDIEDYNIYEIPFNFEQYNNSDLIILLQGEKNTITYYKISETLKIGFEENLIEIQCKGAEDKDIFYSTGIKHILRVPYDKIIAYTSEENEYQKNDDSVYLIDSEAKEGNEFFLESTSFKKYRQLVLMLNSTELFIDSVGCVIDGAVSKEDNEETNLLDPNFKVLKSNSNFETFKNNEISSSLVVSGSNFIVNNGNQVI